MATKKPVQYYKVIDPVHGNRGLYYKKGLNVDPYPVPLEEIPSCGGGALYFTDAEHLSLFSSGGFGDHIAWVTPRSKVKKDSEQNKWKAHKLEITKILPICVETLNKIPGLSLRDYMNFDVDLTAEFVTNHKGFSVDDVVDWLLDNDEKYLMEFLKRKVNKSNIEQVQKFLDDVDYAFSEKQVEFILKNNLTKILNTETIRELLWGEPKVALIKKIMATAPDHFLKILSNIV